MIFSEYLVNFSSLNIETISDDLDEHEIKEPTLEDALQLEIIHKYYHQNISLPPKLINSAIESKYHINLGNLDILQVKILELVNQKQITDIMAVTPDNLLLQLTAGISAGDASDLGLGLGQEEFLIKICMDYLQMMELYQHIINYFVVNSIIIGNKHEIMRNIEIQKSMIQGRISQSEKNFRLGTVPVDMTYQGTLYEKYVKLVNAGGELGYVLVKNHGRDIYLVDYEYPNLQGGISSKLPMYTSTGRNFSYSQKNMLSPFNGFAFTNNKNFDNIKSNRLIIQIANFLNINREKQKKTVLSKLNFFVSGKLKESGTIKHLGEINKKTYNIYHIYLIKMLNVITESKSKSTATTTFYNLSKPYDKFKSRNKVLDFLGKKYFEEELKSGQIKYKKCKPRHKYFRFMKNPLEETLEYSSSKIKNHENKKIFITRYFANQDLYSFRNMTPTEMVSRREIKQLDINILIGKENIYGLDLTNNYQTIHRKKDEVSKLELDRNILSYIVDIYSYLDSREFNILSVDLKEVLKIYCDIKKIENNFTLKFTDKLIMENELELERIITILREIGNDIRTDAVNIDKYQHTDFYSFMRLPNHNFVLENSR